MWTSYELFAHKSDIDFKIFGIMGGNLRKPRSIFLHNSLIR